MIRTIVKILVISLVITSGFALLFDNFKIAIYSIVLCIFVWDLIQ